MNQHVTLWSERAKASMLHSSLIEFPAETETMRVLLLNKESQP